jgi:hypothetical protein
MGLRASHALPLLTALLLIACGGSVRTVSDSTGGSGAGGAGGEAAAGDAGGSSGQGGAGGHFAGAAGSAGNGLAGVGGVTGKPLQLDPGSWEMKGVVTAIDPKETQLLNCDSVAFTLSVLEIVHGFEAIVGQDGEMDGARVALANGSYVIDPIAVPTKCSGSIVAMAGVTLLGADTNGDGAVDQISGTANAQASVTQGDQIFTVPVHVELVGAPDASKPTLKVPDTFNPLFAPTFSASEPLAEEASLYLVGGDKLPLAHVPQTSSTNADSLAAVINFWTDAILPLSGTWQVEGSATDLAGHPLVNVGSVQSLADPGLSPQDGFEGPLVAAIEAQGVSVVNAVGNVTAITGSHSLWVLPSGSLTFHLKRAAAEKSLSMSMRVFSHEEFASIFTYFRVGVVGGKQVVMPTLPPTGATMASGDATWSRVSQVIKLSVPLTESGSDVLFSLRSVFCGGLCPPEGALMIDDLKLE